MRSLLALAIFGSLAPAVFALPMGTVAQHAYLKASNTNSNDSFGFSVSLSGDTLAVGAWREDSNATGVNGDQSNNGSADSGAVYVYVRSGGAWAQQAYIKASNTDTLDMFGFTVSLSGDTLVVGAPGERSNSTGVNGDQSNNTATGSGAAYVFVRSGSTWTQQAYLKASNTEGSDAFGRWVAVDRDTIVVTAPGEDSSASGVGGDQTSNAALASGAAYVFVRVGTVWTQQAYVKASNPAADDGFGFAAALAGETLAVGAFGEDSNATGVGGDQTNNGASSSGAAYVFARNAGVWSQQAYLKASNTGAGDSFGGAVTLSGNTLAVGAISEDSSATGVNGNQADNAAASSGAVYVFTRSGVAWSQQAYVKASNSDLPDIFGDALELAGDVLVVGAPQEASNATGVNGDQTNDSLTSSGAAYVFVRTGGVWGQTAYLKASNTGANDMFGGAVSISGNLLVVGADGEDSNATGVNGNQANDSAVVAGAAYAFYLSPPDPLPYCFGDGSGTACPCSPVPVPHGGAGRGCPTNVFGSGALLTASGAASLSGDTLVMTATELINGGCLVYQGTTDNGGLGTHFGDGLRCAAGSVARMRSHPVSGNTYTYPDAGFGDNAISMRGMITSPGTRYYQAWYRSAHPAFCLAGQLFNLTNAVRIVWGS